MNPVGWKNCADSTRHQARSLLAGLQTRLEDNLTGVYLHGSLAMGCFNSASSDIDLLAAVGRTIPQDAKKSLVGFLLELSGSPHPIEISFLRPEDIIPWRHPASFDLHYSEEWRKRFIDSWETDGWEDWENKNRTDPDLAAHITVLRARGIRLLGKPVAEIFPEIPRKDYLAALLADLEWAADRVTADAAYGVLNACRILAYLPGGRVYSKAEGGTWGLTILPVEFHPAIECALAMYEGRDPGGNAIDPEAAKRLLGYAIGKVKADGAG